MKPKLTLEPPYAKIWDAIRIDMSFSEYSSDVLKYIAESSGQNLSELTDKNRDLGIQYLRSFHLAFLEGHSRPDVTDFLNADFVNLYSNSRHGFTLEDQSNTALKILKIKLLDLERNKTLRSSITALFTKDGKIRKDSLGHFGFSKKRFKVGYYNVDYASVNQSGECIGQTYFTRSRRLIPPRIGMDFYVCHPDNIKKFTELEFGFLDFAFAFIEIRPSYLDAPPIPVDTFIAAERYGIYLRALQFKSLLRHLFDGID